jgi:hypothetical protein
MTLHLLQIFLTEALTFIIFSHYLLIRRLSAGTEPDGNAIHRRSCSGSPAPGPSNGALKSIHFDR